jgi:DNA-binding XRE family transcriptional regulator
VAMADPYVLAALLLRGRRALSMSRDEVGTAVGWSKRSIGRWESGRSAVSPKTMQDLARLVHAVDPVLAAEMARATGSSVVELGLEPAGGATPAILADAIVCAAADAMKTIPETARAGLVAAFRRAQELRMSTDDVANALTASAERAGTGRSEDRKS